MPSSSGVSGTYCTREDTRENVVEAGDGNMLPISSYIGCIGVAGTGDRIFESVNSLGFNGVATARLSSTDKQSELEYDECDTNDWSESISSTTMTLALSEAASEEEGVIEVGMTVGAYSSD
jgi:hypothetical protein